MGRKAYLINIVLFLLFFQTRESTAQDFLPLDTVYDPLVRSVYFESNEDSRFLQRVNLKSQNTITLHFDLLEGSFRRLFCSIYHYNYDWTPSDLRFEEYFDGFDQLELFDYQISEQTQRPYVHYQLSLPQASAKFKVTGNFLMVIYDQNNKVFLSRKIYVYDDAFSTTCSFVNPIIPAEVLTHHALLLKVKTNIEKFINPEEDFKMVIMQNGNPNSSRLIMKPNSQLGAILNYNRLTETSFAALNEFRAKDIRTIRSTTRDISYWDVKNGDFQCYLKPDFSRANRPYSFEVDINGDFKILSKDFPNANTRGEYSIVHFRLETYERDYPIYVYGALTDWQLKEEFKMHYNREQGEYQANVLLKNGYFNILYASSTEESTYNFETFEGNSSSTENHYVVLVYYRPFGSRYDQLKAVSIFLSNQ